MPIGLALAALGVLAPAAGASEGLRAHLTWHAPYGTPGASSTFVPVCDDTSARDTLYLTCELPKSRPPVDSMSFVIAFHPRAPDTLGSFWFFKSGWPNRGNLWIDLVPHARIPYPSLWVQETTQPGEFDVSYDHRTGTGLLRLEYAVPGANTPLDAGKPYVMAQVRILHRRTGLEGCGQKVCVELKEAKLRFTTGRELAFTTAGEPFAGWNARCPGFGAPDAAPPTGSSGADRRQDR